MLLQQRHKNDKQVKTTRIACVVRNGELCNEFWCNVVAGDVVRLQNNEYVPVRFLAMSVFVLRAEYQN